MNDKDYQSYLMRAEFFNGFGRTLDGTHGMMTRKDPTVEVPDQYKPYLDNVDGKGKSIHQFISDCLYEVLKKGWGAVFLDTPSVDGVISKVDAEKQNIAPYMTFYSAQDLYNWHRKDFGRNRILDSGCLHEWHERRGLDAWSYTLEHRYRLLELDVNGFYRQTVKNEDGAIIESVYPTKAGKHFTHIPLYTMPNTEPEKPLFMDLVNLNLSWFRKSADIENAGHLIGVDTPYVLGYEPETRYDEDGNEIAKDPIYLGGTQMLCFPQGVTGIGYLSSGGNGLDKLRSMLADDEERMAILGARIISSEKKGVEAVDTARIHRAGENSVLAAFANNMSHIFKQILIDYLEWSTQTEVNPDDINVQISTDYDVSRMNAQELTALVSLWQSGGISKRVLFSNIKDGEIIPNDYDFEDMEDEIAEEKEQSTTQQFSNMQGVKQNFDNLNSEQQEETE